MNSHDRLHMAWTADAARLAGLQGAAERLEHQLSEAMVGDYQAWAAQEAEKQIAKHHKRVPWGWGQHWGEAA